MSIWSKKNPIPGVFQYLLCREQHKKELNAQQIMCKNNEKLPNANFQLKYRKKWKEFCKQSWPLVEGRERTVVLINRKLNI